MSWRSSSGAGTENKPQRLRRTVRIALAISIAIHAALVCGLLHNHPPRMMSAPEIIEVSFDIPEPAVVVLAPQIASVGAAASNAEVLPPPAPVQARLAGDRGPALVDQARTTADRVGSTAAGVRTVDNTAEPPPSPTSPGTNNGSEHGQASGWGTFQPARPNLNPALGLPLADAKPRDLLAPPGAKQRTPSAPELPKVLQGGAGISASIADDGSIRFHDPEGVALEGSPLSGRFDVTDQVMKLAGQDPYAAVKRKMADDTREQRLCMARRYQGERQKQELLNLSTKVRRIAARPDLSAPQRRQLVFSIWDECLEESTAAGDYGAMARATIIAIIRESFPEGSELAYRPAELVAMNDQRSSREPFAPYHAIASRRRPDAGVPSETPCALP